MISHSEIKHSSVANITKTNKCKIVKGTRPLINFKFYLDIANYQVSAKIETKITELGGSIEFFLTESVTHFITDKLLDKEGTLTTSPCTPSTPQTSSVSNCEITSNNDLKGDQKIKSRADAMLQRARRGVYESIDKVTSVQKSPAQVAKSRGSPIWNTDIALKFLEKVHLAVKKHYSNNYSYKTKQGLGNAKVFKGDFIKIEAFHKHYRPYYQLIKKSKWPTITLNSQSGDLSIFQSPNEYISIETKNQPKELQQVKTNSLEMTRKSRSSKHIRIKSDKKNPSDKQCGYCEICRVEYDILTNHLKTNEHINFVKNDNNFLELDSLIKAKTSIDTFLGINKDTIFKETVCEMYPKRVSKRIVVGSQTKGSVIPNEQNDSDCDVSKCVRQTRQSSIRKSVNASICDNIKSSGIVRSRRESVKKINYAEPKEDEENSNDILIDIQKTEQSELKVGKSNIRPTVETSPSRPKSKTPLLYKVVETKDDRFGDKKEPLSEKNNEQSIIVKFKKVRQTQLSVLNGEAENFMFPKKMSSEASTDTDRHTTSESGRTSSSIISSEKTLKRKSSVNNANLTIDDSLAPKKRKTSSQQNIKTLSASSENSFLEQSFRRSPIHSVRKKIHGKRLSSNNNIAFENLSEKRMGGKVTNLNEFLNGSLNQYKFSFERIPQSEVWYEVFHRQDESREKMFEYYGNTAYRKLPYEMGPLPPLQPRCCQLCMTKNIPKRNTDNSKTKNNGLQENSKVKIKDTHNQNTNNALHKKKTKALLSLEMPRKSPREHASTLAILSCLIQQRSEKSNKEENIQQFETCKAECDRVIESEDKPMQFQSEQDKSSDVNMTISTQISENVKRLRRGIKLKSNIVDITRDKNRENLSETKLYRNKRKFRKPLEFDLDERSLYNTTERYINVNKLRKEIDCQLLNSFNDYKELDDITVPSGKVVDQFLVNYQLTDLIFANSTKTDKKVCGGTMAAGNKLRLFNIFSTNKKRKNKTGWPTKKKIVTRQQQFTKISNAIKLPSSIRKLPQLAKNEDDLNLLPTETNNEEKYLNNSKSTQNKEDRNRVFSYISASEKVDNSDIFTVSSDSLDTVLDVGSQMRSEDQQEVIESSKSNIKFTNVSCIDKKTTDIYKRTYRNRRPRTKRAISKAQTDDCENKISDQLTEQLRENSDSLSTVCEYKTNLTKDQGELNSSLNLSPRRLRKPRGKWYRER